MLHSYTIFISHNCKVSIISVIHFKTNNIIKDSVDRFYQILGWKKQISTWPLPHNIRPSHVGPTSENNKQSGPYLELLTAVPHRE